VSVNGHLLLQDGKLHMAGGNVVAVASYDLKDGKCLTDPLAPASHTQFKAGSDLYVDGDQVMVSGAPLYSTKGDYRMVVSQTVLRTPAGDVLARPTIHDSAVALLGPNAKREDKPVWTQKPVSRIHALAVTRDAVLVTGTHDSLKKDGKATYSVMALSLKDGETLWKHELPVQPVLWGLTVDREGRAVVSLEDGRVMCFGREPGR
jgi:hypothetical protein